MKEKTTPGLHDCLIKHLPLMDKSTNILDIGCGTGAWLNRLFDLGYKKLYGIDKDISQLLFPHATIQKVDIDIACPDFGNMNFGLISAIEVIEHLENPGRLIFFVSKLLEKDGFFLLTTPNVHSIETRLRFFARGQLYHFDPPADSTHINPVFLTGFKRLLKKYNLDIVEIWGYPEIGYKSKIRKSARIISNILRMFLQELISGEIMCLLIKKEI